MRCRIPQFIAILLALALVLIGPAQAAGRCPDSIALTKPANGSTLGVFGQTVFRWSAEPEATATRDFVLLALGINKSGQVGASGEGQREASEPFRHKLSHALSPGLYSWLVVFRDAHGKILCTSAAATFKVGGHKAVLVDSPTSNHESTVPPVIVQVVVYQNYVVVLFGSKYLQEASHPYDVLLANGVDNYDASTLDPTIYKSVTIYGNENANVLTGTGGNDTIKGYAGNDTINGGDGDDRLEGGDESCADDFCNQGKRLGDVITGGAGNDTIYGGNESCRGKPSLPTECNFYGGALGDTIDAGEGNDLIYGGNESCEGQVCNYHGYIGDTINGGDGNDTLNGGDESCTSTYVCNELGYRLGDVINGGPGDDTINGGNESCDDTGGTSTTGCDYNGNMGDTIDGGAGFDTGSGGTEGCKQNGVAVSCDFPARAEDIIQAPSDGITLN